MNFWKAKNKAKNVAANRDKLLKLIQAVGLKLKDAESRQDLVAKAREGINTFIRMLKAYVRGEYRQIPWKTLTLITAGLIYFVNPFDLMPDFIPISGFVDDVALIFWIFNRVGKDIDDFREWEENLETGQSGS